MKKTTSALSLETSGVDISAFICEPTNYFGEALKEIRLEKRLSQGEVSKQINLTQSQLSFYENGKSRPSVDMMILLAKALDVSPFELLGRAMSKSKYLQGVSNLHSENSERILENAIKDYKKKRLIEKFQEVC